ncbi:MAG: N-acetylgalactosamine 6-sulfate sulfatase, partial [Planctomycetales bacterium]|nr:N-acetylgalactosamine 6-sulfate sulfatase [Planctomycetales bacterium]
FKLHRIAGNKGQQPRFELYDLVADREESRDLAADQPERIATMSRALEAWQQSVVRSLNGEDYTR